MNQKKLSEKALLFGMIISMLLWGLSWPSNKYLTHFLSPVNFLAFRYILVIIALFPILLFLKVPFTGNRKGLPLILSSGMLLAIYSVVFYLGLKNGFAGAGGVLVTTLNPLMAYSIGIMISRRWPSKQESIGLLTGLIAGCILLKIWNSGGSLFESGNLFFLAAAFIWAAMSKITSRAGKFGSPLGFIFWQYVITLVCIIPFANLQEFISVFSISDRVFWFNLFFSSVVVTSLATTVFFYAATKLGAERASSFIFLVPFGAEISSWVFLDEKILTHTVIGGVLGILAVFIINRKKSYK